MIPINRSAGAQAIPKMMRHARQAMKEGRQIIIFPEGTRRAVDAPPDYKYGVARIYDELKVPCVPIALNSGLFWPRRKFLRYPGTIIVEILDPIEPGLAAKDFLARLQAVIETATARLIAEGRADLSIGRRLAVEATRGLFLTGTDVSFARRRWQQAIDHQQGGNLRQRQGSERCVCGLDHLDHAGMLTAEVLT